MNKITKSILDGYKDLFDLDIFDNKWVSMGLVVFSFVADYLTFVASANTFWAFTMIIRYIVCLAIVFIIDGVPVLMNRNGDLKDPKNEIWLNILKVAFTLIFLFRILTGNSLVGPKAYALFGIKANFLLKLAYSIFNSVFMTAFNIMTSLVCFYATKKRTAKLDEEKREYFLKLYDMITELQRAQLELNILEDHVDEYYDQYDKRNREIANDIVNYYRSLWKLQMEIVLLRKTNGDPDAIEALLSRETIFKDEIKRLQRQMKEGA